MSANIWKVGTSNAFSTTLNGGIADSDATIALSSVTGLQAPGVIVVDRVDANNTATPTLREFISFTGIAGSSITGCSRGLGGSTAQAHNSGAKVEETWSTTHWNDFVDTFAVSHDSAGRLVSTSTATLTNIRLLTNLNASGASVVASDLTVANSLNVSGASIVGFSTVLSPVFSFNGTVSGPTSSVQTPLIMPRAGTWDSVTFITRTVASGVSSLIDLNLNGTSIFTNQATRPRIGAGGTFVSTASIGTKTFNQGDKLTWDYDGTGGTITDFNIQLISSR